MMMRAMILTVLAVVAFADEPYPRPAYGAPAYENHPPQPYEYGYEIDDGYGNKQQRAETQDSYGNQKGSYSYQDAYGLYRTVEYTADHTGFRANVKTNEPGTKNENPADVYMYAIEPPAQTYQPAPYKPAAYAAPAYSAPAPVYPAPAPAYEPRPAYGPAPYKQAPYSPAPYKQAPAYQPQPYGASYSTPTVRVYNNRPQGYAPQPSYQPEYRPAPQHSYPRPAPAYKPQVYQPAPKPAYQPAPYPAPKPHYQPAPPTYASYEPQPAYPQPPPHYEQAAPAPSYVPAPANYGQQRQYAAAAVRAAVSRRHPEKRQAYDPAYSGDIEVSQSEPVKVNLKPAVEYAEGH